MSQHPDAVISVLSRKLRRIHSQIRQMMEDQGLTGIDISHGDILYTLMYNGPQSMQQIAKRIDRDKSTVTSLVAKLEKRGYVTRSPDPEDKRSAIIALADKGKELKPGFDQISNQVLGCFWQGVSDSDKEFFMSLLDRVFVE